MFNILISQGERSLTLKERERERETEGGTIPPVPLGAELGQLQDRQVVKTY